MPAKPPKKIQDILPIQRRSIRDVALNAENAKSGASPRSAVNRTERGIRVPIHVEHAAETRRTDAKDRKSSPPPPPPPREPRVKKMRTTGRNLKWYMGGIGIVCCLGLCYAFSLFLARSTVNIVVRSENIPIDGTYTAAQNAESPDLSFIVISTTTTANVSVPGSPGAIESTYATGMAVLVNASSPSTQRILAGTRLTDSRGLIYKTVSTVVIPAATSKSSGTAPVKIIASLPGPAYNSYLIDLKGDLSITVWKGTAKAKIFYGRMTTDVTGGTSGPKMTLASSAFSNAKATLSQNLSSSAPQALKNAVPAGYVLYPTAITIAFSSTTIASLGSSTALVSMRAAATGIIFKKSDLENSLAKNQIAQFPADTYEVDGIDSLVFSPLTNGAFSPKTTSLQFRLSGDITVNGILDPQTLKNQLKGKSLSASNSVFASYGSIISGAEVRIEPFWIHTIPSSPNMISLVISTSTS